MSSIAPRDKTEEWDMAIRKVEPEKSDALRELEARAGMVPKPEERGNVIAAQVHNQLDMIYAYISEQIKNARAQLDELEALIGSQCAATKSTVDNTASMASTILNVAQSTAETIKALRTNKSA